MPRAGENGPILASTPVEGVKGFGFRQTTLRPLEEVFPDGSRLYESGVMMSPLREDVSILLVPFEKGVTFEDGTTEKRVGYNEFDDVGCTLVRWLVPADVSGPWHPIKVYQSNHIISD